MQLTCFTKCSSMTRTGESLRLRRCSTPFSSPFGSSRHRRTRRALRSDQAHGSLRHRGTTANGLARGLLTLHRLTEASSSQYYQTPTENLPPSVDRITNKFPLKTQKSIHCFTHRRRHTDYFNFITLYIYFLNTKNHMR